MLYPVNDGSLAMMTIGRCLRIYGTLGDGGNARARGCGAKARGDRGHNRSRRFGDTGEPTGLELFEGGFTGMGDGTFRGRIVGQWLQCVFPIVTLIIVCSKTRGRTGMVWQRLLGRSYTIQEGRSAMEATAYGARERGNTVSTS